MRKPSLATIATGLLAVGGFVINLLNDHLAEKKQKEFIREEIAEAMSQAQTEEE